MTEEIVIPVEETEEVVEETTEESEAVEVAPDAE
jgi:hypothetical protein